MHRVWVRSKSNPDSKEYGFNPSPLQRAKSVGSIQVLPRQQRVWVQSKSSPDSKEYGFNPSPPQTAKSTGSIQLLWNSCCVRTLSKCFTHNCLVHKVDFGGKTRLGPNNWEMPMTSSVIVTPYPQYFGFPQYSGCPPIFWSPPIFWFPPIFWLPPVAHLHRLYCIASIHLCIGS